MTSRERMQSESHRADNYTKENEIIVMSDALRTWLITLNPIQRMSGIFIALKLIPTDSLQLLKDTSPSQSGHTATL